MAFQPIVDLQEKRIDGFEALVRGPDRAEAAAVLGQVTAENVYAFDQSCWGSTGSLASISSPTRFTIRVPA